MSTGNCSYLVTTFMLFLQVLDISSNLSNNNTTTIIILKCLVFTRAMAILENFDLYLAVELTGSFSIVKCSVIMDTADCVQGTMIFTFLAS